MPAQALAVLATLASFATHGNRIELKLDRGSAEMVWVSDSGFHFRRTMDGPLPEAKPETATDPVALQVEDTPVAVRIRSKTLDVSIAKQGLLMKVTGPGGAGLLADASEARVSGERIALERLAPAGVRYYGLGRIDGMESDLRGRAVETMTPLLISSAGYGEQQVEYSKFDFTAADRYRIQTPRIDYYFFYGPTPKEIFKQRIPTLTLPGAQRPATWSALKSALLESVHDAMSTPHLPAITFSDTEKAAEELKTRIRQIAGLIPNAPIIAVSPLRRLLNSFFDFYEVETRDKNLPIWRPLPMQFPDDAEGAHHADEFMLGDELLIAPIYEIGNKRQVYLPPGSWTNLETSEEYAGRTTISVETPALPVFARNGAIVPLDSSGGIGLHYFPKAGGEFFLLEKDSSQYTQVHAAPALDVMRLQIESKKDRDYQWVVHHIEKPAAVGFGDVKFQPATTSLADRTWAYDAEHKILVVKLHVKAGEDSVVNVSW